MEKISALLAVLLVPGNMEMQRVAGGHAYVDIELSLYIPGQFFPLDFMKLFLGYFVI